jgi:hypothetical protein
MTRQEGLWGDGMILCDGVDFGLMLRVEVGGSSLWKSVVVK